MTPQAARKEELVRLREWVDRNSFEARVAAGAVSWVISASEVDGMIDARLAEIEEGEK